jgi:hypothetical protein
MGPADGPEPQSTRAAAPNSPRLHNAGPAHVPAHCPAPATRGRATHRACLAPADAPRRDEQNLPRRVVPRDGSREHEPRTCAIAQRLLLLRRQTYAYACTGRTRDAARKRERQGSRRTPEDANHATARSGLKEGAARCGPRYGEERSDGANSNVAATAAPTSPTSIDLTTATSGRRPADALVQGAGVIAGKRVASIASIAIAEGRVLPGIRPTVLGTLSIELVVVVCAVRVEMACGPGAWQPLLAMRGSC